MKLIDSNRAFHWVISPYREVIVGAGIKKQIFKHKQEFEVDYVCVVNQKYFSFSTSEGQDFAMTLLASKSIQSDESYIYVERHKDGYLFIRIYKGELIEDRLLHNEDELLIALNVAGKDRRKEKNYQVEAFAVSENERIVSSLEPLIKKGSQLINLKESYIEKLLLNPKFSFVEFKYAERNLADKNLQSKLVFLGAIAILAFLSIPLLFEEKKIERVVLKDDYKEYREQVSSKQSASILLAQDYNMHRLMKKSLSGWRVYKVAYLDSSIKYSVILDYGSPATLQTLREFTHSNNLELVFDSDGTHIIAPPIQVPPYQPGTEKIFNLDELVANIVDNANKVTPFVSFNIDNIQAQNALWGERKLFANFKGATDHDLLRLAAVLDGYPTRYPVLIKDKSFYQVGPNGFFSEGLSFSVIGEM
ncbi:MAG: hypothetical protein P8I03_15570 [Thalassotalea sp.]|nr:hypothetical protein [Thalassotalea sp.]